MTMVDEITAAELHERLGNGDDIQVIDIRPERAFRRGHIPGAENIPFRRFTREVNAHDWRDRIVIACPRGESSLQAARLLESYEGIDDGTWIANLSDGYEHWDYELETDH